MSLNPIPTEPETAAVPHSARRLRHLQVLDTLLDVGVDLTLLVQQQAHVEVETAVRLSEPAPDFTCAFERMSRTVRRTILLAEKLEQPAAAPATVQAARNQVAARKRIIRAVEDAIDRDAPAEEAESLHAEFLERLDGPDVDEDIGTRPDAEIIADIRRDLGLATQAGGRPWKRRTPQDIALLCSRAALKLPATGPFVAPMPPRGWTYSDPLFSRDGAEAARLSGGPLIRGP